MIWGIVAWQMTASQTEKRSEMSWEVGGAQDRRWHTCGVLLLLLVVLIGWGWRLKGRPPGVCRFDCPSNVQTRRVTRKPKPTDTPLGDAPSISTPNESTSSETWTI